ncbi:MAG: ABC transporter substrate-binding protein [bacterium]
MSRPFRSPPGTALILLAVVAVLSTVGVTLPSERVIGAGGTPGDVPPSADPTGPVDLPTGATLAPTPGQPVTGPGTTGTAPGLQCVRGRNGGATDVGVTGSEIRLASTVVLSGPGESFLGLSPKGMQAVVNKVNRQGGICGRQVELTLRDDGWDRNRGRIFLQNFIQQGFFALPVVPSSEGLTAAIEAGDVKRAGMPVVGSDGMLIEQYRDPWVWPVATATVSTMRVMARYGYSKGARTFGVVFDNQYRFGREGADAFRDYVRTLSGASVPAYVPIQPGQSTYGSEVKRFNDDCNPCDMVVYLLEPSTAETWMSGRPKAGRLITSGAQTLFNRRFAANCGATCQGMLVWTGYTPPIGAFASRPDVAEYVNDVRSVDPSIDVTNAFLEGAYLGMTVFVEALRRVGPNLTRRALRDVLNSMIYQTDLVSSLTWSASRRHANLRARAFSLQYAAENFSGFRDEQTGWLADPRLG